MEASTWVFYMEVTVNKHCDSASWTWVGSQWAVIFVSELVMALSEMCSKICSCCPRWSLTHRKKHLQNCSSCPLMKAPAMGTWASELDQGAMEEVWPDLMNHIFFHITWMSGGMCFAYLGNTWHQDALWEEGKLVEAVWCFGQCSAGKPWVLPSKWMLIWQVPPT